MRPLGQGSEQRSPRPRAPVGDKEGILFAQDGLDFRVVEVNGAAPSGREILASAGLDPEDGLALFAVRADGRFEDVRLYDTYDLEGRGLDRFVAHRIDRSYKFRLNGGLLAWGKPIINGATLYALSKPGPHDGVFLKHAGKRPDRVIEQHEVVDLTSPMIQRFVTARRSPPEYEVVINGKSELLSSQEVTYEDVVELAYPNDRAFGTFSMTYRHGACEPPRGELGAGGRIKVKPQGTIFDVTRTIHG